MDGLTCVREIRKLQATKMLRKDVPVFAVTANARVEQPNAAREQGMLSLTNSLRVLHGIWTFCLCLTLHRMMLALSLFAFSY